MLINAVASSSGVVQTNIKKTDDKLLAAISSLVSGNKTQDVADLAIATQLQSQVIGLKQVSQSLAQAASLTQVASGALEQSQKITDRLQEIALQASNGATNQEQRTQLDQEFQQLVKELDSQVARTCLMAL
jgi:flagellin